MLFKKYIRYFKENDWDSFAHFVKGFFPVLADKAYVRWQYTPPYASGNTPRILLLEVHKKILGYLGTVPLTLSCFGKDVKGVCLANLLIDPALRGKGAGVDFVKRAEEEGDIVYSVGLNEDMRAIYRQDPAWHADIFLRRFVCVLDSIKISKLISHSVKQTRPHTHVSENKKLAVVPCSSFDEGIDRLWDTIRHKYPITISRTSAYLNWRYRDHPIFSYHLLLLCDDAEVEAYIVLRIEKANGYIVARIIDCVANDEAEHAMFDAACKWAEENGAHMIDLLFSGPWYTNALTKSGFVEAVDEPYSLIPIRFSPISANVRTINFAYTYRQGAGLDDRITVANNWYVTKGDGDQDRPNLKP